MRAATQLRSSTAPVALLRDRSCQVYRWVSGYARADPLIHPTAELERYADKYRPAAASRPKLERRDLHQPFFPQEVFEAYFDPRKKRKCTCIGWVPVWHSF
jgi:hypothetical protein